MTQPAATMSRSWLQRLTLNSTQREAVFYTGGPELVFAGAGAGKTRVLTAKIAYLIESQGVPPSRIFAATFTNKAARQMQARVEELTGIGCTGLWIGTFHSLCARILRREAPRAGYSHTFTIYDADDQVSVMKAVCEETGVNERVMDARQALDAASRFKNQCVTPEDAQARAVNLYDREAARLYAAYCRRLLRCNAMDFDDLIAQMVYLLRRDAQVRARYQAMFDYVLVDEYQDTNLAQFYLIEELVGARGCVFAVGDDDQSIYAWRGARIENILSFDMAFPGAKVFTLEQNYRSTQPILRFANAAIAPNERRAGKRLWTQRETGEPVSLICCRDDRHEADLVCEKIGAFLRAGVAAKEIGILFRTNVQSRAFEEALRRNKIAYTLVGITSFFERKEIKDCLAYLRLLVNPCDEASFERIINVPPRGLGEKAFGALAALARQREMPLLETALAADPDALGNRARNGLAKLQSIFQTLRQREREGAPLSELVAAMLDITGYADMLKNDDSEESAARMDNISELVNMLAVGERENPQKRLSDFLEEVALTTGLDRWQQRDEAVNLMTLHCAKGLEFRVVFLAGLEDGVLPSRLNFDDEAKMEEERRLLYVGITRARDNLVCLYARQRMRFGNVMHMERSRFLADIPPDCYRFSDLSIAAPLQRRGGYAATAPAVDDGGDDFSQETVQFRLGQNVAHPSYGRGRIVSLSGYGRDLRLTVLFGDGVRRKLMAAFAGLEIG